MSGAIQASTNATSGANAAAKSEGLPTWAIVAVAVVAAIAFIKVMK